MNTLMFRQVKCAEFQMWMTAISNPIRLSIFLPEPMREGKNGDEELVKKSQLNLKNYKIEGSKSGLTYPSK